MSVNIYREAIEKPSDRVIVALDGMDWETAQEVMGEVGPYVGIAKANSLAQRDGWLHAISVFHTLGALTMADTKFHDIPKTVELQVKEVSACDARLITVHASGGKKMLESAIKGRDQGMMETRNVRVGGEPNRTGILGITVLTSLKEECASIYGDTPQNKVLGFAKLAQSVGLDGIVCSGEELEAVRADSSLDELLTVVPGITPHWAQPPDDQKRIVTPREAHLRGADFQVVGRAITLPPVGISRAEAAQRIAEEIKEAA